MIRIGRYKIAFGRYFWFQTKAPVAIYPFLCFLIIKEASSQDVDKHKQFPLGTTMEYEGRSYRYYKAG